MTRAILLIKRLPDALVGNAAAALAFGGDHLDDLAAAGDKAGIRNSLSFIGQHPQFGQRQG